MNGGGRVTNTGQLSGGRASNDKEEARQHEEDTDPSGYKGCAEQGAKRHRLNKEDEAEPQMFLLI